MKISAAKLTSECPVICEVASAGLNSHCRTGVRVVLKSIRAPSQTLAVIADESTSPGYQINFWCDVTIINSGKLVSNFEAAIRELYEPGGGAGSPREQLGFGSA